jgi:hypothetical protein
MNKTPLILLWLNCLCHLKHMTQASALNHRALIESSERVRHPVINIVMKVEQTVPLEPLLPYLL